VKGLISCNSNNLQKLHAQVSKPRDPNFPMNVILVCCTDCLSTMWLIGIWQQIWDSQTLSLVHVLQDLHHWVRSLALNFNRVWPQSVILLLSLSAVIDRPNSAVLHFITFVIIANCICVTATAEQLSMFFVAVVCDKLWNYFRAWISVVVV